MEVHKIELTQSEVEALTLVCADHFMMFGNEDGSLQVPAGCVVGKDVLDRWEALRAAYGKLTKVPMGFMDAVTQMLNRNRSEIE